MAFPIHHNPPPPAQNRTERPAQVRFYDVQWNRPIFKAPSLPTASQIWSEIPFTARGFTAKPKNVTA